MYYSICADILRELRQDAGLSKSKMAQLLNIDDRTYGRYESGDGAPTLPEFLSYFDLLGRPALPVILRHLYPERYDGHDAGQALVDYAQNIASPRDLEQWAYIVFGDHGSLASAQLQLFTAIDHLPMRSRLFIAKSVLNLWEIESEHLVNLDQPMPDMDALKQAIIDVQQAMKGGRP